MLVWAESQERVVNVRQSVRGIGGAWQTEVGYPGLLHRDDVQAVHCKQGAAERYSSEYMEHLL